MDLFFDRLLESLETRHMLFTEVNKKALAEHSYV